MIQASNIQGGVDPLFFNARPHLNGRDSFCVCLLENHLKKTGWSRHLFLFLLLKGKTK